LNRRVDDQVTLVGEIVARKFQRNARQAKIKWMSTTEKAREKLRRAYPVK
jgi:hypothetical protein